jgi:hypothetical protein
MLGQALMGIINYEGPKDTDLQSAVVNRLLPLMKPGGGFTTYCNATVRELDTGQPHCAMIQLNAMGISLDTYTAYLASKDSFPAACPREFPEDRIGYWVGAHNGRRVHAILLFDAPTPKPATVDKRRETEAAAERKRLEDEPGAEKKRLEERDIEFILASQDGHLDRLQTLIEKGANVNATNKSGPS